MKRKKILICSECPEGSIRPDVRKTILKTFLGKKIKTTFLCRLHRLEHAEDGDRVVEK